MVNLGIDGFGGDAGPKEIVKAAVKYATKNKDARIFIYGDIDDIYFSSKDLDIDIKKNLNIEIVDCKEKIEVSEHPVFALRTKKNSSIYIAGVDLNDNKIDAFISSGSTGVLLALAKLYIKCLDGVDRPVIATIIPTKIGKTLLLDSGANMDSKPEWLYSYAKLGIEYAKGVFKEDNPKVGLLNVGVEETKGNQLILDTYKLLKDDKSINFVGNVEARDIPFGIVDIVISDAFNGNVFLKTYEGTAKVLFELIKQNMTKTFLSKVGALLVKNNLKHMLKAYDATNYGGAPLLGAKKLIIKCHGNATEKELVNALYQASEFVKSDFNKNFINKFGE